MGAAFTKSWKESSHAHTPFVSMDGRPWGRRPDRSGRHTGVKRAGAVEHRLGEIRGGKRCQRGSAGAVIGAAAVSRRLAAGMLLGGIIASSPYYYDGPPVTTARPVRVIAARRVGRPIASRAIARSIRSAGLTKAMTAAGIIAGNCEPKNTMPGQGRASRHQRGERPRRPQSSRYTRSLRSCRSCAHRQRRGSGAPPGGAKSVRRSPRNSRRCRRRCAPVPRRSWRSACAGGRARAAHGAIGFRRGPIGEIGVVWFSSCRCRRVSLASFRMSSRQASSLARNIPLPLVHERLFVGRPVRLRLGQHVPLTP